MARDTNFEVWDEVVIRDWDDMAKEYGTSMTGSIKCRCFFTIHMKSLCGWTFVMEYIDDEVIRYPAFCLYIISTDMIRKVDDPYYNTLKNKVKKKNKIIIKF